MQNGTVSRTYSYGLELVNERQSISGTPTTSFYGFDGHGSVRFLTNSTGAVTDTYDYDAFGNLISSAGSTPNNYLFAGEQFDPALGIYYNRARYYDQRNGRFWSMDTWEADPDSPASLHRYLYASANPVNNLDPSGHQSIAAENVALAGFAVIATLSILSLPQTQKAIGELAQQVGTWAGEAYDELSYAAQRAFAAAEVAITSAYTSVEDAIEKAKEKLKRFFRKLPKVVPMPERVIPHIADHVRSAMLGGQPFLLTRTSPAQARINRRLALGWRQYVPAGPGLSWDEYPFASSDQGGIGASVRPVPADENFIQGGIIAGSYLLQGISIGDEYVVVVIP